MTLKLNAISHDFGDGPVLQTCTLQVQEGEILALLGASGCGKTTLLRLMAGLEPLQVGEINLDERLLSTPGQEIAPEHRSIGLVFQDHALFPGMTVAENVGFGLRNLSGPEKSKRVDELLGMAGLDGMGSRMPGTLSGGQQQRVALIRALAPKPRVLLMDEPFASIDQSLRRTLRGDARRLLKDSKTMAVLVTHDPEEALDMADRIAVMKAGQIVQVGTPDEILNQPKTADVAALFGDAQVFQGRKDGGSFFVDGIEGAPIGVDAEFVEQGSVTLVVRDRGLVFTSDENGPWRIIDTRQTVSGPEIILEPMGEASNNRVRATLSLNAQMNDAQRGSLTTVEPKTFLFPEGK